MILLWAVKSVSAEQININKNDVYIKKGFSAEWIDSIPADDASWLVAGPTRAVKTMRVSEMALPGMPKRHFFSYRHYKPENFTFITSFNMAEDAQMEREFLGLYIDQIGENWEVYLNGKLLKSEMHVMADGEIKEFRNQRRVLIYINPLLIKPGKNILAFRIVGDPTIDDTGFYANLPILIDNYEKLARKKMRLTQLILLFVYLVVGLYLLLLYLFRRSELYNLVFAFFSIMFFIYLFCRTSTVYMLVPNTHWTLLIEFISLYTLLPLIMCFMELILHGRIRAFVYGYGIFCIALIALSFVSPYSVRVDILRIWQYTSIITVLYILFQITSSFIITVRHDYGSSMPGNRPNVLRSLINSIMNTVPGNLMVGALVAAACAAFDVLDAMFFTTGIVLSNYGFMVFIIGITMVLSNRYVYLHREIDGLSDDLVKKTRDLKETRVKYGISKEKYRLLVEGSTDIIFSLDEKFNFITANKALCDLLRIPKDDLAGKNLIDVLYQPDGVSVSLQFIHEKLGSFLIDKKPLHIKLDFKIPFGIEPQALQVRFEYINIEGRYEIFGRGMRVADDALNQYLLSEQHRYRIGNMLIVADDLSVRITRNLDKFIGKKEVNFIRLAIREMLINAIEHGNLAITFEEKTRELENDNYFTYLNQRQKDPRFSGRTVEVLYSADSDKISYTITDQGKGFEHLMYLDENIDVNEEFLSHGRGISLAKNIFDEIRYNETGNSVMLVKWLNRGSL